MHWMTDQAAILDSYQRDGFVIIKQFLDGQAIAQAHANLQRYIEEIVPHVPDMDAFCQDATSRDQIRMLPRMDHHDSYFRELLHTGRLHELASMLCGEEVCPRDAAFFNKLPQVGDITPPHQDGFYFHLEPCEALTLWLALDDVDEENGCVRYVCGSHRHGIRNHHRTNVLGFSQGIVDYGTEDDLANEVAACVAPGDLIAHHALTVHRCDTNRSPRTRRALGFVYFSASAQVDQASSAEYQRRLAEDLKAEGKI